MRLVFPVDTHYGHLVEDAPEGAFYQDDGTRVDEKNLRPCKGCGVSITPGTHDPCIANLPGAHQACCGHGLHLTPRGNLAGYAALNDGRSVRFSGCLLGKGVREAIAAVQQDLLLPDGFVFADRAWWEGLTDEQRAWVQQNIPRGLAKLVTELKGGEAPSEKFLRGEALWFEELDEEQKRVGRSRLGAMLVELVQESLLHLPPGLVPHGPDVSPNIPDAEQPETAGATKQAGATADSGGTKEAGAASGKTAPEPNCASTAGTGAATEHCGVTS